MLRGWRDVDRGPFAELNADPHVAEFLGGPLDRAASDALVDRILARWDSDGHRPWAVTTVTNVRSRAVMERLGMTHDPADDFDHPSFAKDPIRAHVLYRLGRETWRVSVLGP